MKLMKRMAVVLIVFLVCGSYVSAQNILSRVISIEVKNQRLRDVLEIISNKGDFFLSYNSSIVRKDLLISLSEHNKTVKEVLSKLFDESFEFRESGNYLIIRKAPIKLTLVTNKAAVEDRFYIVTGHVYDDYTGTAINEASVYDKKLLSSALTNTEGFFRIKLKSAKATTAALTVSKEFYEDTTVLIEPRHNQQLTITMVPFELPGATVVVSPEDYLVPDSLRLDRRWPDSVITMPVFARIDSARVEQTRLGRFLVSAKQKAQSINLRNFFTTRGFQVSLTPGLSNQGYLSGQVVNNFSLNVFGGYTGGTNGVEVGGLFNINKRGARYAQVAGMFNVVGGPVEGAQIAGIHNNVLDSVKGVQVAGVSNLVTGKFTGWQVAGIYNHVADSVKGVQIGGVANFARKKISGVQIAGVINFSNKETDGVQISGVFNYSKKLRGVQIGLINISDTSEGYSIGLINIVLKGYHKLSVYSNETTNLNVSFKTGNRKFYNILFGGYNTTAGNKAIGLGYGLGSEMYLNKKRSFTLNPELTSEILYLGTWDHSNILSKVHLNFQVKLSKWVSLYAGPSYSLYISDQVDRVDGFRSPLSPTGAKVSRHSNRMSSWLGWNAGISFF